MRAVEVWERFDGSLELLGDGRRLSWEELGKDALKQKQEWKKQAARKPIVNNRVVKPGAKQRIRFGRATRPDHMNAALR